MEELRNVPSEEEIDRLYTLIRQNPDRLHSVDKQPFVDTPLHFAAREGRTRLALEIQRLMPSFGRKLNPDGWSPLHVALRSGHMDTAIDMVKLDPQLVGVQGREGMTPLHYMAERENVKVLAQFLYRCPDSINQLTIDGETAVHVAVRNSNLRTVRVLVGWLKRRHNMIRKVLRMKDRKGNTVLHLAAETNQPEVIELLVRERELYLNDMNLNDSTALDIAMGNERAVQILQQKKAKHGRDILQPRISTLERYLTSPILIMEWIIYVYMNSEMSTDTKNSIAVVAVLIITATFQTALSPPGGFSNQSPTTNGTITTNHNITGDVGNGKVMMPWGNYFLFTLVNSIAFATSLGAIFLTLPLAFPTFLVSSSLALLITSYLLAIESTRTSNRHAASGAVTFASLLFLFFAIVNMDLPQMESPILERILTKCFGVSSQVIQQLMDSRKQFSK